MIIGLYPLIIEFISYSVNDYEESFVNASTPQLITPFAKIILTNR